jgi:hypothetical protein
MQELLPLGLPSGGLELRILQNFEDLIGRLTNEVCGLARHHRPDGAEPDGSEQKHGRAASDT